jgi:hypothetical protein
MITEKFTYYFNSEYRKIDCNTSYKLINQEINKLGIVTSDITISQLLIEMNKLLEVKHSKINKNILYYDQLRDYNEFNGKLRVLYKHIIEDAFNLYSYKANRMPIKTKRIFNCKYR